MRQVEPLSIMGKKPRWNEADIQKLTLAREMGASLEVLSKLTGRSPTAVNKALTRLGIRPLGSEPRGIKPGHFRRKVSLSHVEARLANNMATFSEQDLSFKGNTRKPCFTFLKNTNPEKYIKTSLPLLVNVKKIISYWHGHGIQITEKTIGQKPYFEIEGKMFSPAQLLAMTNQKRVLLKETLFWMDGVTEF
ncbi:MAG: hypothetical protein H2057_03965 [Alphaproteobacteria bacterium]|nr:hypothetical protein [Alphaproteobacteria bacterium]